MSDRALLVGTLGMGLLAGALVGKLLGASYDQDVETLCNAERASGFTLSGDAAGVTTWLQEHLTTPEGHRLLASLRDMPLPERSRWLEERAGEAGRSSCPMVQTYDDLSRLWDARRDLQSLCSTLTFPEIATLDGDARLELIDEWIETRGEAPILRSLPSRLRQSPTPADRAEVLRDAASDVGVLSCDVAKILAVPFEGSCGP
jgi:hypothetical protein